MKNWRELGEVPDSDDEYDSDELTPAAPQQPTEPGLRASHCTETAGHDIWDIPSSQEHSLPTVSVSNKQASAVTRPSTPPANRGTRSIPSGESSPLSPPPPEASLENGNEDEVDHITPRASQFTRTASPNRSCGHTRPDSIEPREQEDGASTTPKAATKKSPPRSNLEVSIPVMHMSSQDFHDAYDESADRQEALRLSRSLRPRKPIQEHPYLLESAQYSTFMKRHGVRPIRVAHPESPKRNAAQDDSQEQDYVAEEEGDESGSRPLPESEESQDPLVADFPPSSPEEERAPRRSQGGSARSRDENDDDNDDELPSLSQLLRNPDSFPRTETKAAKRKSSPLPSPGRKKLKVPRPLKGPRKKPQKGHQRERISTPDDICYNLPLSSGETITRPINATSSTIRNDADQLSSPGSSLIIRQRGRLVQRTVSGDALSTVTPTVTSPLPISMSVMNDDEHGETSSSEGSGGSSESEIVRNVGRRIRGVLPASWLRFDQPKSNPIKRPNAHSPSQSPERTQRRGVAQRRRVTSTVPSAFTLDFSDDEDEDNDLLTMIRHDNSHINISSTAPGGLDLRHDQKPDSWRNGIVIGGEDSDMEDDMVDAMLPSRARSRSRKTGVTKKRKVSTFSGTRGPPMKQPKIKHFIRSGSGKTAAGPKRQQRKAESSTRKHRSDNRHSRPRLETPPPLSILDVAEPEAPPFIRVAARTARKRGDRGKSSPTRKAICLATRSDNIDALSVLRDWKQSRIKPRVSAPTKQRSKSTASRQPLGPRTSNTARTRPSQPKVRPMSSVAPTGYSSTPKRFSKQQTLNGFATNTPEEGAPRRPNRHHPVSEISHHRQPYGRIKSSLAYSRPVVLETETGSVAKQVFEIRKQVLDSLYVNPSASRGTRSTTSRLDNLLRTQPSLPTSRDVENGREADAPSARSRFRKRFRPRRIDVEEPQYARANDPIPEEPTATVVELIDPNKHKLGGLGPYGTHYTPHFEAFPLDLGVFFHSSTLIGSGRLKKATNGLLHDDFGARPLSSFDIGKKTLQWGMWNETVASELGILMDWLLDKLQDDQDDQESDQAHPWELTEAATFIIRYFQDSLSFASPQVRVSFVARVVDVTTGFLERSENSAPRTIVPILSRLLLSTLYALQVCRKDIALFSESLRLEDVIKLAATNLTGKLLALGTDKLTQLYQDLQRPSTRESGIRSDATVLEAWVVLMHAMGAARVPRLGFWDVVTKALANREDLSTCLDAQVLERWWNFLFILLPLGEMDSAGVLVPRRRLAQPLDGWQLPQLALKRVFTLYQNNRRQSPSFNSYVGALVSRCYYLVSQWGWRNATTIIGTIFDFFGGIEFRHLRNEQVDHSPDFLDQEGHHVSIDSGDCVFHIYLKLLALVLGQLRSEKREKETRNLIARITPNHNRHFDRESSVDLRDLASLRNHHDLLCTMYLFVSPELRPSPALIQVLVSPETSHKEACLINLAAWRRLAKFVVREIPFKSDRFEPLAKWYRGIHRSTMHTIRAAAEEVESTGGLSVSGGTTGHFQGSMIRRQNEENLRTATAALERVSASAVDVLGAVNDLWEFTSLFGLLPPGDVLDQILEQDSYSPTIKGRKLLISLATSVLGPVQAYMDNFVLPVLDGLVDLAKITNPFGTNYVAAFIRHHGQYFIRFWSFAGFLLRVCGDKSVGIGGPIADELQACAKRASIICGNWIALRRTESRDDDIPGLVSKRPDGFTVLSRLSSSAIHEVSWAERRGMVHLMASCLRPTGRAPPLLLSAGLQTLVTGLVLPKRFKGEEHILMQRLRHLHPSLSPHGLQFPSTHTYHDAYSAFAYLIQHMSHTVDSTPSQPLKKAHREDFSAALSCVMHAMKQDLRDPDIPMDSIGSFTTFVQKIVALIREYGYDLGVEVDSFFLSPSEHYSPDPRDPNLLGPILDRYVRKLENKANGAETQLFYFLYNSYLGLRADSVVPGKEDSIPKFWTQVGQRMQRMRDDGRRQFFDFFLGTFLPATVLGSSKESPQPLAVMESFSTHLETMQRTITSITQSEYATLNHLLVVMVKLLGDACTSPKHNKDVEMEILRLSTRLFIGHRRNMKKAFLKFRGSSAPILDALDGVMRSLSEQLASPILGNQANAELTLLQRLVGGCRTLPDLTQLYTKGLATAENFARFIQRDVAAKRKWKDFGIPHLAGDKGLGWAMAEVKDSVEQYAMLVSHEQTTGASTTLADADPFTFGEWPQQSYHALVRQRREEDAIAGRVKPVKRSVKDIKRERKRRQNPGVEMEAMQDTNPGVSNEQGQDDIGNGAAGVNAAGGEEDDDNTQETNYGEIPEFEDFV
ncbi:Mus7/MMS22 family-domain-containing protein [Zalerion maritima]|uniref:Mus7/MMS22 family-domain-containing protein n=1 Tax=Zalerion maritima TaxID=339359 RepID=A0AAD5RLH5_9PEZI|nr:Mus7/MMS22 family-domain-containing protein [Zalerion maritima]